MTTKVLNISDIIRLARFFGEEVQGAFTTMSSARLRRSSRSMPRTTWSVRRTISATPTC
jgi:hypothetical protein